MKKLLGILVLGLLFCNTGFAADNIYTYLKCKNKYIRFDGSYLKTNYNIRTKLFKDTYYIKEYTENRIVAYPTSGYSSVYILNRNTGELKIGWNGKAKLCEVISRDQLPRLNETGKVF